MEEEADTSDQAAAEARGKPGMLEREQTSAPLPVTFAE